MQIRNVGYYCPTLGFSKQIGECGAVLHQYCSDDACGWVAIAIHGAVGERAVVLAIDAQLACLYFVRLSSYVKCLLLRRKKMTDELNHLINCRAE